MATDTWILILLSFIAGMVFRIAIVLETRK
jgi:hypothetical protein